MIRNLRALLPATLLCLTIASATDAKASTPEWLGARATIVVPRVATLSESPGCLVGK